MPHRSPDAHALAGLRGIRLLEGLPEAVLAEVGRVCRFRLFRARQEVIARADVDRDCYLIISGRVRVVALSAAGREVSFRDAGAGETIGEMAALDGRPRSATVVALQDTLVARISPEDLAALLQRHWPICERMLRHLAGAARAMTERVYELSTLSVQQRLCAELLRRALAAQGPGTDDRIVLQPAPSHRELAARISTSREQVTRELAELVRLGIVSASDERAVGAPARDERHLVIEDLARLAERVEALRATA